MKILKIIFVILMTILIINIFEPKSSAVNVKNFDEMRESIRNFMEIGQNGDNTNLSGSDMGDIIMPIANILTVIGVFILVGVTIIMGIKYMFATPEQAAKLKEQLIGLIVAAVIILGATAVWRIVYSILVASGL